MAAVGKFAFKAAGFAYGLFGFTLYGIIAIVDGSFLSKESEKQRQERELGEWAIYICLILQCARQFLIRVNSK
jgi:hypothetical protein